MFLNYYISDFFASLNVAKQGHMKRIHVRYTKNILIILKKMQQLGLVGKIRILNKKYVEIFIKYSGIGPKCVFNKIKIISKPSKRVYLDLVKFDKFK